VRIAAFLIPAIVYIASASPEPGAWDTAELQGVPYILGISHPTGFPLYVMIGYLWSHLFAIGSIAWRMNAMSGVAIGVACAAAYVVARRFGASPSAALLATLWFAFSQNAWAHAARAEAQDVAVMCCALAIYAFVRWMQGDAQKWFVGAFALCGLGMAAHPNALWILPAFVVGAFLERRRLAYRPVFAAAASIVAGLLLYGYLPLRSAYVANHGLDPAASLAGAGGGIFWNYNDPRTPSGLALELTGSQTETPAYFIASFNPLHVKDALWALVVEIRSQYGVLAGILLVAGFVVAWRRQWRTTLVVAIACTAALLFSAVYPNESDVGRYRLLVAWLAVPFFGALTPRAGSGRRGVAWHAALILFLGLGAGLAFEQHRSFFHHAPREGGRWVIDAVRPYVPAGGAIVTGWLDATSLAYGAYVDGSLPGRIVVSDDALRTDLYRRWAKQRPIFVLVNPRAVSALPGARDYAALDAYHELYSVQP
jgi:hypothetical protein